MMLKTSFLLFLLATKTYGHEGILENGHGHLRLADNPDHRRLQNYGKNCAEQSTCVDFTLEEVLSKGTGCAAGNFKCQYKVCAKYKSLPNAQCPVFSYVGRDSAVTTKDPECFDASPTNICSPQPSFGPNQDWCVIANPNTKLYFVLREGSPTCDSNFPLTYPFTYGGTTLDWQCEKNSGSPLTCDSQASQKECAWSVTTPIEDAVKPTLLNLPSATVPLQECDGTDTLDVGVSDNLDSYAYVEVTDVPVPGDTCDTDGIYSVTRTWTAYDHCGNFSPTETRIFEVKDKLVPTFLPTNPLPDITVEAGAEIPKPKVTDDCLAPVVVDFVEPDGNRVDETTCNPTTKLLYHFVRTWRATDHCGRITTATQTIHVKDTTPPALAQDSIEVTVECGDTVPDPNVVDDCATVDLVALPDGAPIVETCGAANGHIRSSYTRSWTATDCCGNVATLIQTVKVKDLGPTLTVDPIQIIINCGEPVPNTFTVTVTDKCDTNSLPTIVGPDPDISGTTPSCAGGVTSVSRKWTATDSCENTGEVTQNIVLQPATPPAPTPTKKKCCFSASNSVNVQGKGIVAMKYLQVGDMVQTSNHNRNSFSRVMSFFHMDHDTEVDYLQIHTDALDMPLEITPDHFLFVDEHQTVRAQDVKVGDALGDGTVTSIQSVKRQGLYAPATQSGEIMVSGTPASCYIDLLYGMAPSLQAAAMHAALAPLRFVCGYDFSICKQETYMDGGISSNLGQLFELGNVLADGTSLMQWLVVIVCFPALLGLLALEMMLTHGKMVTLALGGYFMIRQKKSLKFE